LPILHSLRAFETEHQPDQSLFISNVLVRGRYHISPSRQAQCHALRYQFHITPNTLPLIGRCSRHDLPQNYLNGPSALLPGPSTAGTLHFNGGPHPETDKSIVIIIYSQSNLRRRSYFACHAENKINYCILATYDWCLPWQDGIMGLCVEIRGNGVWGF